MGAAVAKERIMIPETVIEVPKTALVRLLIVDDEGIRETWKELFTDNGFHVDAAATPEDAIILLNGNKYDVVVIDIRFDNSSMTGDRLITEYSHLMKGSTIVAATALSKDLIERIDQLEAMDNVLIVEKGSQGTQRLTDIVKSVLEQRKLGTAKAARESLLSTVDEFLGGTVSIANELKTNLVSGEAEIDLTSLTEPPNSFSGTKYLLNEVQQMLVEWFRTRENPDAKSIIYAGRPYSTHELANEVESGSQIGIEQMEAMLDVVKRCLNLK